MIKNIGLLFVVLSQTVSAQLSTDENYIYSKTCLNEDCSKKTEAVEYRDGLGRTKQAIQIKGSPSGKDIVSHFAYDLVGRQLKTYLPVPQQGTNNGGIYINPLDNASSVYGNDKIYTETVVEESPVGKPKQTYSVGNAWAAHPKTFDYNVNTTEQINQYSVSTSWVNGATNNTLTLSGNYPVGKLLKVAVTDEDGNTSVEFKNGQGQTILVRKELNSTKNADTYYVYNKYGQLAFVVPPNAVEKGLTPENIEMLCYQYKYDAKGRQVEKKLPGKGWEYIVYDKLDRVVMTQDANMGQSKMWLFTKYDQWGRVLYTGNYTGSRNYGSEGRQAEQNDINANTLLSETGNSGGFNATGVTAYYTNNVYPKVFTKILTVNYYDTYPQGSPERQTQILGQNTISDNLSADINTKNLATATYIKNIEDDNWTKSYIWYDEKLRAVATHTINHLGGYTRTESEFDFVGAVKQSKVFHQRLSTDAPKTITQTFDYDSQNRLLVHKHQVDNKPVEILVQNEYTELSQLKRKKVGGTNPASPLETIEYTYNIRGSVIKMNDPANLNGKLFGYEVKYNNPVYANIGTGKFNGNIAEIDWKNASEDVLKRYTYTYDKLNRLQDAIYTEPNSTTPYNNHFNENITYDISGNIKTLKRNAFPIMGNTSTMVDDLVYDYNGNRLLRVTENALNDTGYEGGNNMISYDLNGNMKDMLDKGIQRINYNYLDLADGLSIVQTNPFGQVSTTSVSYLYRADGTKLRKTNFSSGGKGSSISTRTIDYLDGFQYENFESNGGGICLECRTENAFEEQAYSQRETIGKPIAPVWILDFVATAEGFYSFTENRYIYQYKDHLGNTRVSFAKNSAGVLETLDTNNYYPFGLNHIGGANSSALGSFYSYKYNGKELQETGFYDFGARMYMPDIARWGVADPLAETTRRISPYNYAMDNPVMFIDPDGRKAYVPMEWTGETSARSGYRPISNDGDIPMIFSRDGGGGGINVILNFIRGDVNNLGNFVNSDFTKNGWKVIDATSLQDALKKLIAYLGNSQADNIYINAHGLTSHRYILDENGQQIPDLSANGMNGLKVLPDTGFYTNYETEKILGTDLQQYIADPSQLASDKKSSIESLIAIGNYVKEGKNLIMGSCLSANDELFGTGLSSLVKSRDIFANRDFSSLFPVGGKITFQEFTGYNQTSQKFYEHGWVWYKNGAATQTNFNIIMTKYGVKTIK